MNTPPVIITTLLLLLVLPTTTSTSSTTTTNYSANISTSTSRVAFKRRVWVYLGVPLAV